MLFLQILVLIYVVLFKFKLILHLILPALCSCWLLHQTFFISPVFYVMF